MEGVSACTYSNLPKLTKNTKQVLTRYVTEYARDEVSKRDFHSLSLDLIVLIFNSGTVCGGCNTSLEYYEHDKNSVRKKFSCLTQQDLTFLLVNHLNQLEQKNSLILVEGKNKCYRFARVLLLF